MSWIPSYKKPNSEPTPPLPDIVTWSDGTDEEIAAMLEAHYAGQIDIHDYWSVGDERTVRLNSFTSYYNNTPIPAQNTVLVLLNAGGKYLEDGTTECAFIVGMKNCFEKMDSGDAYYKDIMNAQGYSSTWDTCNLRNKYNYDGGSSFYTSALPSTIKSIFKKHRNITASDWNSSSRKTSLDYFALASEKEITGTVSIGNASAESNNAQFEYYTTTVNKIKYYGTSSTIADYFTRTPGASTVQTYATMHRAYNPRTGETIQAQSYYGYGLYGISLFGVI